jgi:hypothetical protein
LKFLTCTGKSKGKGNNKIRNNDKKRTRSDKPLEFVAQKSSKVSKDDTVEATAAVPDDIEVKDETEENFKNVLGDDRHYSYMYVYTYSYIGLHVSQPILLSQ